MAKRTWGDARNPDRWRYQTGGGWLALFGLPFLGMGLYVPLMPLLQGLPWSGGLGWSIPFSLPFLAIGAGLVFGRHESIVDRAAGTATGRWKLGPLPLGATPSPLVAYDRVAIRREVRRAKNSSYHVYAVKLQGSGAILAVDEPRDPLKARRIAEDLARFLGLDLHDASEGGETVVRTAAELDMSIRERMRGQLPEIGSPGRSPRATIVPIAEGFLVDLPPSNNRMAIAGSVVAGFAGVVFIGLFFGDLLFDEAIAAAPASVQLVFGSCALALLAGVLAPTVLAVRQERTRVLLEATPRGLRVAESSLGLTRQFAVRGDVIEEIEATDKAIVVRSDERIYRFGRGLKFKELAHLRARILHALCG